MTILELRFLYLYGKRKIQIPFRIYTYFCGCAIGIGNVWRFPYVVGNNGGGCFVLFYVLFLVILGLPILTMEFSVGRASQQSIARAFTTLEKKGQFWHLHGYIGMAAIIY